MTNLRDRVYWIKEHEHLAVWHRVLGLFMFVLIIWGMYRFLFRLPVWFEELVLKGLVFGLPVLWVVFRWEGWRWQDLGIRLKGLLPSVVFGLGLGMSLGIVGNLGYFWRMGEMITGWSITAPQLGTFLVLALVTAFWEGLFFAGYVLKKLQVVLVDEWLRAWVVAGMFTLVHVPALLFVHSFQMSQVLVYGLLIMSVGLANMILMLRTGNLAAPILAQTLWGTTVFLFQ